MIDALLDKVQNKWMAKVNMLIAQERSLYMTAYVYMQNYQNQPKTPPKQKSNNLTVSAYQ